MVKAVIFDIDGLLLNTEPLWDITDDTLLRKRGFNLSKELRIKRVGTGQKNGIELFKKEFGIKEDTGAMIAERINIFNSLLDENLSLMKGVKQLIKSLDKKKFLLAIATGGHSVSHLKKLLEKFDILKFFSVIVGRDDVKKGKPDPQIFLHAAHKLHVKPSDCLVLEDAPSGVEAGKRAGMHTFGINSEPLILKKLKEMGADRTFTSLTLIRPEHIP